MGIPKKGSRTVEVEGRNYRYILKETHVLNKPKELTVTLTVQEDVERPGRVFQAVFAYGEEVSPKMVREVVQSARQAGWDPAAKGAAFMHPLLGPCDKNGCSKEATTVELEDGGEPWPSQLCLDHARHPEVRGTYEHPRAVEKTSP